MNNPAAGLGRMEENSAFSWFDGLLSALLQRMKVRQTALILGFALVALLGYWLAGTAVPEKTARQSPEPLVKPRSTPADEPAPKFRREKRPPAATGDLEAKALGALEGLAGSLRCRFVIGHSLSLGCSGGGS